MTDFVRIFSSLYINIYNPKLPSKVYSYFESHCISPNIATALKSCIQSKRYATMITCKSAAVQPRCTHYPVYLIIANRFDNKLLDIMNQQ